MLHAHSALPDLRELFRLLRPLLFMSLLWSTPFIKALLRLY
jgi:hypothetical protein